MNVELHWSDLKKGDRVRHFDYGIGTVHDSGPLWIFITWDNPDERLSHHTPAISRYLELVAPSIDPD